MEILQFVECWIVTLHCEIFRNIAIQYGGDNRMRQRTVREDMEIFMGRKDHCWRCAFLKPPTATWVGITEQIYEGNTIKRTSRSIRWHASFVYGRSRIQILARRPAVLTKLMWRSSVPAGNFQGSTLNYIIHDSSFTSYLIFRHYTA
jgi:hypothetical protein